MKVKHSPVLPMETVIGTFAVNIPIVFGIYLSSIVNVKLKIDSCVKYFISGPVGRECSVSAIDKGI